MEPITVMLFAFGLIHSASVDLVYDEDTLIDGIIETDSGIEMLNAWEKSNNGYFGATEEGNHFYLIVTENTIKIKIWQDDTVVRLIEPIL